MCGTKLVYWRLALCLCKCAAADHSSLWCCAQQGVKVPVLCVPGACVRLCWTLTPPCYHPLCGHSTQGTGKTVYVKAALEALDKAVYGSIQTAFSAQTNANMVQVCLLAAAISTDQPTQA